MSDIHPKVMRLPTTLDLLAAITRVATAHPTVTAWWLTPRARLPLRGAPSGDASVRRIELVVETPPNAATDYRRIERDLVDLLPGSAVAVRPHLREDEPPGLMRLFSTTREEGAGSALPREEERP